ncbi:RCC1 and BTB domain-containing protein 1 [Folsomia candida]|uniref:RCC1 and BTB domain-containing protein 1 n=1 Tax=Folsomia candida TaxID=158441 RepID=UPI0016052753|nr:RCC1 and BTB domain-containing protein 1 [Folsomia candida]
MGDLVELRTFQLTQKTIPLKELRKWKLFNTIGDGFLLNVRLAHVHEELGFLVTTDDDVYAFGTSYSGSLGIGSITRASIPVKIDPLCGQMVKEFAIGSSHCFAITADGRVFTWGDNSKGRLGIGTNDTSISTPTLVKFGEGVKIDKISAGGRHTLGLTMDTAEVFSWGWNACGQLGLGNTTDQDKPCKVPGNLQNIRIQQISCSFYSSFALSESGDVYSWGLNDDGELCLGNTTRTNLPTKVTFDKPVKKIANGLYHTLLLTTSGEIYASGYNGRGQLGTGNTTNLSTPTKIAATLGIFDDISCMPFSNQSSAKSADKIFIWGEIHKGITCSNPTELEANLSNFPPLNFIKFKGTAQIMHQSLCASNCAENPPTIRETLQTAIDGAGTDVAFKVEGHLIRVHKSILILRSDYFSRKFSQDWKQLDNPIELQDIKRDTFYALLYYLYTDKIYFSDGEIDKILDLLKLADMYCDTGLKGKCESVLEKQLALQNVLTIYVAAGKCSAPHLRDAAFNFGVENWMKLSNSGLLDQAEVSSQDLKQFVKAWGARCEEARVAENSDNQKYRHKWRYIRTFKK